MNAQRDDPLLLARNLRTMLGDVLAGHDSPEGVAGSHAVAQALIIYLKQNTR